MILRWLLPLGFLGMLGVIVLLALYLLKPQYKTQTVSGTLIWKRVLLRKKRQRPVLSHILVFLLQALLLIAVSLALAQPYLFSKGVLLEDSEYVIILDASASMRTRAAGEEGAVGDTRFDKALKKAEEEIDRLFAKGDGAVSLILADSAPHYLVNGAGRDRRSEIDSALRSAICSSGTADLEEALEMARGQLDANPYIKIFLYTDTKFGDMGSALTVVDLADESTEWNVAVLGCDVAVRDNEYEFGIRLGAYGNVAIARTMRMQIRGADNGDGPSNYELKIPVSFEVDPDSPVREALTTVKVRATDPKYGGEEGRFFDTFEEVRIEIPDLYDSIPDDDVYFVYGGVKDKIAVEYCSAEPNTFWQFGFSTLTKNLGGKRKISFREIYRDAGETAERTGYDFYLFEHAIPPEIVEAGLPQDGVLMIADPNYTAAQANLGFRVAETVTLPALTGCTASASHPLLRYNDPSAIGLTQYKRLEMTDPLFLPVLYCNGDPVIYVKDTGDVKIVVLAFSLNMSDFYQREFMIFLYNMLETFMPVTLDRYDYTVGERAQVNCKGVSMDITGRGTVTLTDFPAQYLFTEAGTYTFTTHFGSKKDDEVRKAYAHIVSDESAIFGESDFRIVLDNRELTGDAGRSLLFWFAVAAVLLLVLEWYIQFKDIV